MLAQLPNSDKVAVETGRHKDDRRKGRRVAPIWVAQQSEISTSSRVGFDEIGHNSPKNSGAGGSTRESW